MVRSVQLVLSVFMAAPLNQLGSLTINGSLFDFGSFGDNGSLN
jgi:hypothetical protein